ncbi:hypothetical protein [Oscillatoria acuminata]|uniref:hypothetical protein n=1 Tax=Oscillatoria acuminata TaxID=118323 RepID=UPI00031645BC|nr:hypothetical protein [Oscillatoria acuminata]
MKGASDEDECDRPLMLRLNPDDFTPKIGCLNWVSRVGCGYPVFEPAIALPLPYGNQSR